MESEKFTQKIASDKMGSLARTFVVGLVLSLTFFLMFIDSFKTYQAEISIMVSAKSEVAAKQQAQIVANMMELPKTLAFYDRMLTLNPDMRDVAAGKSNEQRKQAWNQMLSIKQASFNASVINIVITADRQSDAVLIANKTSRELFDTAAFYYDIKKDVDLRIVDGPITKVHLSSWYWLVLLSLVLGFVISSILEYFISASKKIAIGKPDFSRINSFFDFKRSSGTPNENELESLNDLYRDEQLQQPLVFEKKIENNVKFQEMKKLTKEFEPSKYPNFPEMPIREKVLQASAPDNLPISDEMFFPEQEKEMLPENLAEKSMEVAGDENKIHNEPTEDELKDRLNQLLRGEL